MREIERIWRGMPGYDRRDLPRWLRAAVPLSLAAQRQSSAITEAFVARSLGRRPIGIDRSLTTGRAIRSGADPEEVYTRPFVTLWTALGAGVEFARASEAALARATGTIAMDVQMSARATFARIEGELGESDGFYGYERVADAGACEFCQEVDGAYVKNADGFAMALHNHCGCSLEPLTEPHRNARYLPDGTEIRPYAQGPLNEKVAIREHGELGPLLGHPAHDFAGPEAVGSSR